MAPGSAPEFRGVTRAQERHSAELYRETRYLGERIIEGFRGPFVVAAICFGLAAGVWAVPALAHVAPVVVGLVVGGWALVRRPVVLPMRLPIEHRGRDWGDRKPGGRGANRARGVWVLGNEVEGGTEDELHQAGADARQHYLVLGATGSGKTEILLSLAANPLTMGGGMFYVDAKAELGLAWRVMAMARAMGREHDLLVVNYLTGGAPVDEGGPLRLSNTVNPFAFGSADALTQALTSLLPGGSGSDPNQVFLERAVGLISAIMYPLVELRDRGEVLLSPPTIREYLSLEACMRLSERADLSSKSRRAVVSYLRSLPGYQEGVSAEEQSEQVHNQFGFAQMYYTRMMALLSEVYGHLFWTPVGELDWEDAVVNDRIVLVLLPALEKAPQELRALGKLNLSTLRAAISVGLGNRLEGERSQVHASAHASRAVPTLVVLDEYGYIAAEGFGVVPAQARGLGFSLVFAAQDWAGVKRGSESEAGQVWGNTKTKIVGATEDPETVDAVGKMFREGYVTQTAGFSVRGGDALSYQDRMDAGVDKRALVDPRDLMGQMEGEAHIFWRGSIIRARMAYANPPKAKRFRVMRFLRVTLSAPVGAGRGPGGSEGGEALSGSRGRGPVMRPVPPERVRERGESDREVSESMRRVDEFARMLGIDPGAGDRPAAPPMDEASIEAVSEWVSEPRAVAAATEVLERAARGFTPPPEARARPASESERLLMSAITALSGGEGGGS